VTGVVTDAGASGRVAPVRPRGAAAWDLLRRGVRLLWWLAVRTTRICLRYRVTGLASEVGFFALLSLPPLVLGLVGSIGFVGDLMGPDAVNDLRQRLRDLTLTFLTADSVSSVILPTFDQVVSGGRADIVSIGFVLSLWSGSRVLNVYLDTVSIMYGLGGLRGIVRTRVLSFSLYCLSLVLGIVVIPLVLIGPGWLSKVLRGAGLDLLAEFGGSDWLYWPVVSIAALAVITGLYHLAVPIRARWYRDLAGAALALAIWVGASFVLRWELNKSVGGPSIYGPLATPIVVLIWLYFLAIAVLIGAALNAAIDERWPTQARVEARTLVRERNADKPAVAAGTGDPAAVAEPVTLTPLDPRPMEFEESWEEPREGEERVH
jgi:membrane protein